MKHNPGGGKPNWELHRRVVEFILETRSWDLNQNRAADFGQLSISGGTHPEG